MPAPCSELTCALTREQLLQRFPEHRRALQASLARLVGMPDAEDLTAETLLRALDAVDGFRGQASLATWLQRIGLNLAYDLLRARRRHPELPFACDSGDEGDELDAVPAADPDASRIEQQQMSQCVRDVLGRLPAEQRQLLHEAAVLDRPLAQLAGQTGITTGNAKIRLYRARQAMKTALAAHCDFAHESNGTLCCVPKTSR